MATKSSRLASVVLALAFIISSSAAHAGAYGVNQTINKSDIVSSCTLTPFSCTSHCSSVLASYCQTVAPTFCYPGDSFISASFGGTYPSSNCSGVTSVKPSPFCILDSQYFNAGTASCSGSCNALCEENFCECSSPSQCESLYGDPGFGTWECLSCQCILTNSPLVLHLPDYIPTAEVGPESWWKKGFCGSETPTVCLDWIGDSNVSCTAWFEPGSENALIITMNADEMFRVAQWDSVRAQPWRHFFGNVTEGPEGDHPYKHGFAALAAYCGQDPTTHAEIDLTKCGESLFAWVDRDFDGEIEIEELLDFPALGIKSLGHLRRTGLRDNCGNKFPFESDAICANGKCGTVLDVFFQPR